MAHLKKFQRSKEANNVMMIRRLLVGLHQGERAVRQRHGGRLEEAGSKASRRGKGSGCSANRLGP